MEQKVVETYTVGEVTYDLLHAQKFLWNSKLKNADGSFKYSSTLPLDKESLKVVPDVVVEIANHSSDFIRVSPAKSQNLVISAKKGEVTA